MNTANRFDRLLNLAEIGVLSLAYGAAAVRTHTCTTGDAANFAYICQVRLRRLIDKLNTADFAASEYGRAE